MSAYADLVLAHPNLVHLWGLSGSAHPLKGSTPVSYGTATTTELGRVQENAVKFNRSSPSQSFVNGAPPPLSGAHSVELLFRIPTGPILGDGYWMFGFRGTQTGATTALIQATNNTSLYMTLGNGSADAVLTPPPNYGSNIARDVWHHLVIAIDAAGGWAIYLDGASLATGTWSMSGTPMVFDALHNLTIGNYGRTFDANWAYAGWMQHFAVYNVKLDLATAQAHNSALGPAATITYRAYTADATAAATYRAYTFQTGVAEEVEDPSGQLWPKFTNVDRPANGQMWPRVVIR